MADFNQPVLSSLYVNMLNDLKSRDIEAVTWMSGSNTNVPTNAKRWNTSNNYFEKFNGTSWVPLASKYMIDVDKVDGCTVNDLGTANTDLWTAAKMTAELSTKLSSSAYTANDILTKLKTVDGASSGLDADLLDGMHASSTNTANSVVARDASGNFSAGTITANLTGTASTAATLTGLTSTVAELNFSDGVTSNIQTQLNGKLATSAKAADSAKLNGAADATTATANTIVKRNSSGQIHGSGFNSTLADTTSAASHYYVETNSDGWLRPKPIANVKSELFTSPALTGTPTAPTASSSTNNTQIATTAFVQSLSIGNNFKNKAAFTSSGTWVCPAGITRVFLRIVGGGGGGGGCDEIYRLSYTPGTGGGGGSAAALETLVEVSPGTSYSIVVGAGGTGGSTTAASGGTGGTSSALGISIIGGTGGGRTYDEGYGKSYKLYTGSGGASSPFPVIVHNQNGKPGTSGTSPTDSGKAGDTAYAGVYYPAPIGSWNAVGVNGNKPGMGGGGGKRSSGSTAYAGGAGYRGQVEIFY